MTSLIQIDGQDHNDALRELLGLDSPVEAEATTSGFEPLNALARAVYTGQFYSRGLVLPNGTDLRARYKGVQHFAKIEGGDWIDDKGNKHSSPSAAASAITGTTVNGWRFWEGRLPGDRGWRRLDVIRNALAHG